MLTNRYKSINFIQSKRRIPSQFHQYFRLTLEEFIIQRSEKPKIRAVAS